MTKKLQPATPEGYMPLSEASMLAGVSVPALRKRIGDKFRKIDGRTYISIDDLAAYLAMTRKKQMPNSTYINAIQACYILKKSRAWLDSVADRGHVRKMTIGWNTYFSLIDILELCKRNDERQ